MDKESYVRNLFDSIARRYDFMNLLMTGGLLRLWQREFARYTGLSRGGRALDVCCGTAELALIMARQVGTEGVVYGIDFSLEMLEVGRQKVSRSPFSGNIQLMPGNALDLPFEDSSFDCASIGFAFRNVKHIGQVVKEMTRVVRPGGRVVSLELTKPEGAFKPLFYFYFRRIVPLLGRLVETWDGGSGPRPYTYLPLSLSDFPDRQRLADIFRESGLDPVWVRPLAGGATALHVGVKKSRTH